MGAKNEQNNAGNSHWQKFKTIPSIKLSFAKVSIGKELLQYSPPVSTQLVSTPKKFIVPTIKLTQKRFVPHKTKQILFKKWQWQLQLGMMMWRRELFQRCDNIDDSGRWRALVQRLDDNNNSGGAWGGWRQRGCDDSSNGNDGNND